MLWQGTTQDVLDGGSPIVIYTVWHQIFDEHNFVDFADGSSTVKIVLRKAWRDRLYYTYIHRVYVLRSSRMTSFAIMCSVHVSPPLF